MAKLTFQVSYEGDFVYSDMEITETTKDSINTYDLSEAPKRFDGKLISAIIKEELPIEPKED